MKNPEDIIVDQILISPYSVCTGRPETAIRESTQYDSPTRYVTLRFRSSALLLECGATIVHIVRAVRTRVDQLAAIVHHLRNGQTR